MLELKSPSQLQNAYDQFKGLLDLRLGKQTVTNQRMILVCGGTGCQASDSRLIVKEFNRLIKENQMESVLSASIAGCFGFCEKGPILKIFPENVFYTQVKVSDVGEIFDTHILNGEKVRRLLYEDPKVKQKIEAADNISFYRLQKRVALYYPNITQNLEQHTG